MDCGRCRLSQRLCRRKVHKREARAADAGAGSGREDSGGGRNDAAQRAADGGGERGGGGPEWRCGAAAVARKYSRLDGARGKLDGAVGGSRIPHVADAVGYESEAREDTEQSLED